MNAISNSPTTVLDSAGIPLFQGAIVQIVDSNPEEGPSPFNKHRGIVLSPYEQTKDQPQYSVPVFFFKEVADHYFWHTPDQRDILRRWEKEYAAQLRTGDPAFLFLDNPSTWIDYPRVRYFMSSELMICEGFTAEDLIARLFGNNFWDAYKFKAPVPKNPKECMCSISNCSEQATNLTHFNVWGFIHPAYMCLECHQKWNGVKTDGPPLSTLCLLDGTPVESLKK